MIREIDSSLITQRVEEMCIEANIFLPEDVKKAISSASGREDYDSAVNVLSLLKDNYEAAARNRLPICQDTGMTFVFLDIGQDVHILGDDLEEAVNEGVRRGYEKGFLRKSVVSDPLRRDNSGDNTPAVIHVRIVPGSNVDITLAPKGFGSENMSALAMLKPSAGIRGVKDFILDTVKTAGPNACPPMVVGVGIGGSFDMCPLLAKRALLRPVDERNPDPFYGEMEEELKESINRLGIGPAGYGGETTVLGVNILAMATHIAGLPCAVNISCHATRHVKARI